MYDSDLTKKFLEIFIIESEFDGLNEETAKSASEKLGLDKYYFYFLFQDGFDGIISELENYLDDIVFEKLSLENEKSLTKKIKVILEKRIFLNGRYKNLQKNLARYYLLNPISMLKNSYNTIDKIWYKTGDKTTDFNFYTKRAILFTIYNSSILYYLKNDDIEFKKTSNFIESSLKQISLIPKIKNFIPTKNDIPFVRQFF